MHRDNAVCRNDANTGCVVIESLGGYRLIRKIGEGPRAEVFLAHPHRVAADAIPAAIKIFRGGVTDTSITLEIEALSRAAGEHTLELLDLTTAPNGAPALILSRCASGSVGKLIGQRPHLRPGEAITILVPIVRALQRMHDAGVAHGGIRPDAVLFDTVGAPTLACFGHAHLLSPRMPAAGREVEPALAVDLGAMKHLAMTILDQVSDDPAVDVLTWLRNIEPADNEWLDALSERLFHLGEPSAVDLRPETVTPAHVVSPRILRSEPVASMPQTAVFAGLVIPDFIARLLPAQILDGTLVVRVRGELSRVRPRFWIVGGAIITSLLAALAFVPQDRSAAVPPAPQPASTSPSESSILSATEGDDPAAAAVELLAARDACIRSVSVLCLDGVVQSNSAASGADRALVRGIQGGGELPKPWRVAAGQVVVEERLGDTAIVGLGDMAYDEPASLLLMKSKVGWRIRDYFMQ